MSQPKYIRVTCLTKYGDIACFAMVLDRRPTAGLPALPLIVTAEGRFFMQRYDTNSVEYGEVTGEASAFWKDKHENDYRPEPKLKGCETCVN